MPPGPTMKDGLLAAALGTCVGCIVALTGSSEALCPLMKGNIRFVVILGLLGYCSLLKFVNIKACIKRISYSMHNVKNKSHVCGYFFTRKVMSFGCDSNFYTNNLNDFEL